jgi:hypothetical protein
VAGVEGRLAAADLAARHLDLESRLPQELLGVSDGVGEDEVAEARGEELHGPAHRLILADRLRLSCEAQTT